MYLGLGKLVLASTVPSNRHPLNVRSDTGPDLGGGSELAAAPIFLPAAARGERSAPPPPGPPRASWRRSRCTPFRQPGATHGAPTAVESAHNARSSAGGRMRPVPLRPPRPPAAPVRPLPRQPRLPPTARAGRGRAPGRRPGGGRSVATGAAPRQGPARNPAQAPARGAGPGGGCRADP